MTKYEFLSVLRGRITGRIPSGEVEAQIDYYSAYIDGRIGSGLTEEEAVAELGDPMLIAKTVIESTNRAAEAAGYDGPYQSSSDTYADSDGINDGSFGNSGPNPYYGRPDTSEGPERYQNPEQPGGGTAQSSSGGLGCIIAVIVIVLVMAVLWILVRFVFIASFGLLGWLFPLIAAGAIGFLIFRLTRRR